MLSGFWGVVMTDLVQFGIAMFGSITLAIVSLSKIGGIIPYSKLLDLTKDFAALTDSCITSPNLPVICIRPFPGICTVSILSISPPNSVQANPVTIPTLSSLSNSPYLNFFTPKKSDRFGACKRHRRVK